MSQKLRISFCSSRSFGRIERLVISGVTQSYRSRDYGGETTFVDIVECAGVVLQLLNRLVRIENLELAVPVIVLLEELGFGVNLDAAVLVDN